MLERDVDQLPANVTHVSLSRTPWHKLDGVILCREAFWRGHCGFFSVGDHNVPWTLSQRSASLYLPRPGKS